MKYQIVLIEGVTVIRRHKIGRLSGDNLTEKRQKHRKKQRKAHAGYLGPSRKGGRNIPDCILWANQKQYVFTCCKKHILLSFESDKIKQIEKFARLGWKRVSLQKNTVILKLS